MFDRIRDGAGQIFDAMLTKGQSVFTSLANFAQGILQTMLRNIFQNAVASLATGIGGPLSGLFGGGGGGARLQQSIGGGGGTGLLGLGVTGAGLFGGGKFLGFGGGGGTAVPVPPKAPPTIPPSSPPTTPPGTPPATPSKSGAAAAAAAPAFSGETLFGIDLRAVSLRTE